MGINLGLLSGIGTGLKEGMQAYQQTREYNDKKAREDLASKLMQQQAQSKLLENNQEVNDQGEVQYNPQGLMKQQLGQIQTQQSLDETDKASAKSQTSRESTRQLLKKTDPALASAITDDMSAADIKDAAKEGLLGKTIQGIYSSQGRQIVADRMSARNEIMQGNLDERRNQNASHAGQSFETDPILKLSKTNLNSLTRSQSILDNPNKPVTTRDLNLAYTDYVNAVAAGGAATEGKIQRELPETWATEFNNLKAKAGDFDDLRNSPTGKQLIQMLKQNISTVRSDIGSAVEEQASNVHDSYANSSNPTVQKTIQDKLKKYAPNVYAKKYGSSPESNAQLPSQSQGLVKQPNPSPSAPSSGPTPGSVVNVKGQRFRVGVDGNTLEPL